MRHPDRRLAESEFIVGLDYTIADIAIRPWHDALVKIWLYGAAKVLAVQSYTRVQRWAQIIKDRLAVRAWPHGQPRARRAVEPVA